MGNGVPVAVQSDAGPGEAELHHMKPDPALDLESEEEGVAYYKRVAV